MLRKTAEVTLPLQVTCTSRRFPGGCLFSYRIYAPEDTSDTICFWTLMLGRLLIDLPRIQWHR